MAGTGVRTLVCWRYVVFDILHGSGERPEGRVLDQDVPLLLGLILPRAWVCDKMIRWRTTFFGLDPRRVLHRGCAGMQTSTSQVTICRHHFKEECGDAVASYQRSPQRERHHAPTSEEVSALLHTQRWERQKEPKGHTPRTGQHNTRGT